MRGKAADSDSFTAGCVCAAEGSDPAARRPTPPTNLDSQDLIAVQSSQRRETRQSLKGQTAEHGTTHA